MCTISLDQGTQNTTSVTSTLSIMIFQQLNLYRDIEFFIKTIF